MNKKKKIVAGVFLLILVVLNVLILCHRGHVGGNYELHMNMKADKSQIIQVYYSPTEALSEDLSEKIQYNNVGDNQELVFSIPSYCSVLRIDLGTESGEYEICDLYLSYGKQKETFAEFENITGITSNQIVRMSYDTKILALTTEGDDPFFWLKMQTDSLYPLLEKDNVRNTWILNILILLLIDGGTAIAFVFRKKILTLPVELIQNKKLILSLAKNDFKTKYAGSYLGIVWAFIQPIVTILVYWFVFSVGLKAGSMDKYPFVVYLVSGIVPWFFFSDALNGGTNALLEYNYLVKKVVFKISILPMVKVISALFVHAFFVVVALVLCACFGYFPSIATLQIFYYSICTFVFVLGITYITSAIVVFFRDLTQIINIILQVGVWMTPIMWDLNILNSHPLLMKLFKLNPVYYIVSGYRDAMLTHAFLWQHWKWSIYFWSVTVAIFVIGTVIFKRLKVHFADVL